MPLFGSIPGIQDLNNFISFVKMSFTVLEENSWYFSKIEYKHIYLFLSNRAVVPDCLQLQLHGARCFHVFHRQLDYPLLLCTCLQHLTAGPDYPLHLCTCLQHLTAGPDYPLLLCTCLQHLTAGRGHLMKHAEKQWYEANVVIIFWGQWRDYARRASAE